MAETVSADEPAEEVLEVAIEAAAAAVVDEAPAVAAAAEVAVLLAAAPVELAEPSFP